MLASLELDHLWYGLSNNEADAESVRLVLEKRMIGSLELSIQ